MQSKAILWRFDYEELTILQQNEDPDNLTNQQLSNTLMSKMSVFHQKPNKDLQDIPVVGEGRRMHAQRNYQILPWETFDFNHRETGEKMHGIIQKKKLLNTHSASFNSEFRLLDSLHCVIVGMQLPWLHTFACTQKTTWQIHCQLQFPFSARLNEFGPWTLRDRLWSIHVWALKNWQYTVIHCEYRGVTSPSAMIVGQWPVVEANLKLTASIYLTYLRGVLPSSAIKSWHFHSKLHFLLL